MAITTKQECPEEIKRLWEAAENIGFSDFIWMAEARVLMASLPNAGIEDDRVPLSWDMWELRNVQQ